MGLVKINDGLHEDVRRASAVMCRSINAQAEFWMKIGMLAEDTRIHRYCEDAASDRCHRC